MKAKWRKGGRVKNLDVRPREELYKEEIDAMLNSCDRLHNNQYFSKWMIYFLFKHALRVSELCNMRWNQIDLPKKQIYILRSKGGTPSMQTLSNDQICFLNTMKKENVLKSEYVFIFSHDMDFKTGKMTAVPLKRTQAYDIIKRAGKLAGIGDHVHPHQLRHACGNYLYNEMNVPERTIQSYLGHKKLESTARYTQVSAKKYVGLFDGFEK